MNITITLTVEEASYLKLRLQNHESDEPEDPRHERCRAALWDKLPSVQELQSAEAFNRRYGAAP
jgi:hypothetical protein